MTESERVLIQTAQEKIASRKSLAVPGSRVSTAPGAKTVKPRLSKNSIGRWEWLTDEGAFLSDFYLYLRRRIPVISNGLGVWVDLSTNGANVQLDGGSERVQRKADELLKALDGRVYEFSFCGGLGLSALMEQFYLAYYTLGRFAAELVPYADMSGVAYVALVDPFTIEMKRVGGVVKLFQRQGQGGESKVVELPAQRVFYAAFDGDFRTPQGVSLLDSIVWVVEIKEKMLEDMARASHNAGYPRLSVSVSRPESLPGETPQQFVGRANTEFDETVDAFRDLDVDDNIFMWSGSTVDVVGKASSDFNWSINFEKVETEVSAGLRLPAWALGLTTGNTKNWVDAQHDLLMQRVGRGTQHGARFMEWVMNTELALSGVAPRARQTFEPIRDPGVLIQERAKKFEFDRIDLMVQRGYISKDEGARQLGFRRAFSGVE